MALDTELDPARGWQRPWNSRPAQGAGKSGSFHTSHWLGMSTSDEMFHRLDSEAPFPCLVLAQKHLGIQIIGLFLKV